MVLVLAGENFHNLVAGTCDDGLALGWLSMRCCCEVRDNVVRLVWCVGRATSSGLGGVLIRHKHRLSPLENAFLFVGDKYRLATLLLLQGAGVLWRKVRRPALSG